MPSNKDRSIEHRIRWYLFACCALIFVGLFVLCYSVLKGLWQVWLSEDQYSYCVLVPLVFAYFVWKSWPSLSRLKPVSNVYGLVIVIFGYLLFLFGSFALHGFSARFSLICLLVRVHALRCRSALPQATGFPVFYSPVHDSFPGGFGQVFLIQSAVASSGASAQMLNLFGIACF